MQDSPYLAAGCPHKGGRRICLCQNKLWSKPASAQMSPGHFVEVLTNLRTKKNLWELVFKLHAIRDVKLHLDLETLCSTQRCPAILLVCRSPSFDVTVPALIPGQAL